MKRLLLAGVALFAVGAAPALAADIPARMPTKAPVYAPMMYNWSGWYVGIQGGYGWGRSNWTDAVSTTGDFDVDGALIGGTLGVNWQTGAWVLGLEGDGSWSNIRGSTTAAACPLGCETRNDWLATVRGRIGYAIDRVMPYVTGGVAFGDIEASATGFGSASSTEVGWTVGGGLEWAIAGPWTAKIEYLYADLGKISCGTCGGVGPDDVDFRTSIVRAGINYRFGPTM